MNFYLYQITNKVNGKIYVGVHKTQNLDDGYMGSGKILKRAFAKHGLENFEKTILETFNTAAEMFAREKGVVNDEFLARLDTYNLRRGGTGGFDYINSNAESRILKNQKAARVVNSLRLERYGKKLHSPETLEKLKQTGRQRYLEGFRLVGSFEGHCHTIQTKRAIGEANKSMVGLKNSQFGTVWITNGESNKKIKKNPIFLKGGI